MAKMNGLAPRHELRLVGDCDMTIAVPCEAEALPRHQFRTIEAINELEYRSRLWRAESAPEGICDLQEAPVLENARQAPEARCENAAIDERAKTLLSFTDCLIGVRVGGPPHKRGRWGQGGSWTTRTTQECMPGQHAGKDAAQRV